MKTLKFEIQELQRLDTLVSQTLGISRTKVQSAIKQGLIVVKDKKATPHLAISTADKITYDPTIVKIKPKTKFKPVKLNIIFENDDVIVVNKPARLLVHETPTSDEPTLVQALIAHFPAMAKVGDKEERAGLVHRLDKSASGIIIAAKTQSAFDYLKNEFKNRRVKKQYVALVHGKMSKDFGTIDFPIDRSKNSGRMAARPLSQGGHEARTHYDVKERFAHLTLLTVTIETGRTHQIRVHMNALGHPIVGDPLYQQKEFKQAELNRLFLHASQLTVKLPDGETKTFHAPLPLELKNFLKTIAKLL